MAAKHHDFALQRIKPEDVETRYGLSQTALCKWRQANEGPPYYRVGHKIYYVAGDVEEWLASCRVETGRKRSK